MIHRGLNAGISTIHSGIGETHFFKFPICAPLEEIQTATT